MGSKDYNPHHQDGERCGYCFLEWPCGGSLYDRQGVQKWEEEHRHREWQEEQLQRRSRAVRANWLLVTMGYSRSVLEIHSSATGQMVDPMLLCDLIDEIAKARGIEVPSDFNV